MVEFDYIIWEARDIFAFYKIDLEHPPVEEILHDKDTIRRLESNGYFAYHENIRKRVPYALIKTLYHNTCDKFEWITKGVYEGFSEEWFESMARDPIDGEMHVYMRISMVMIWSLKLWMLKLPIKVPLTI